MIYYLVYPYLFLFAWLNFHQTNKLLNWCHNAFLVKKFSSLQIFVNNFHHNPLMKPLNILGVNVWLFSKATQEYLCSSFFFYLSQQNINIIGLNKKANNYLFLLLIICFGLSLYLDIIIIVRLYLNQWILYLIRYFFYILELVLLFYYNSKFIVIHYGLSFTGSNTSICSPINYSSWWFNLPFSTCTRT